MSFSTSTQLGGKRQNTSATTYSRKNRFRLSTINVATFLTPPPSDFFSSFAIALAPFTGSVICDKLRVCRVNELTIDNEQLTIMVSLRDELKLFLNYFRRKFLNCQLSIVNSTTPNLRIPSPELFFRIS